MHPVGVVDFGQAGLIVRQGGRIARKVAVGGFGGGKAGVERVEDALRRQGVKAQRRISYRQPAVARRRGQMGAVGGAEAGGAFRTEAAARQRLTASLSS